MKNPALRRGFPHHLNRALAAVLTLLTLLAWLGLLLLLLTGLLLSAALLTALLLTTLLLLALALAGILVWILTHRSVLSNVGSKRHLDRSRPMARDNARPLHSFRFTALLHFEAMCSGTLARRSEFSPANREEPTMGRYMLLWLLGVPIPILVLIWIFGGLH